MAVLKYYDSTSNQYVTIPMLLKQGGGGSDSNFAQSFTNSSTVTVEHMLGKFPAVTIIDSAGDEVIGETVHMDNDSVTINFSAPFSGKVICN